MEVRSDSMTARCALKENNLDTAKSIIETIKSKHGADVQNPDVVKAIAAVDIAATAQNAGPVGEEAELRKKIEENPNDLVREATTTESNRFVS